MKKVTFDLEPKWAALMPFYLENATQPDRKPETRESARHELGLSLIASEHDDVDIDHLQFRERAGALVRQIGRDLVTAREKTTTLHPRDLFTQPKGE